MKITIDFEKIREHVGLDDQIKFEMLGNLITQELTLLQDIKGKHDFRLINTVCGYLGLALLGVDPEEKMKQIKAGKEEKNDG